MNATAVYCSRQYQPWAGELEHALRDALNQHDVELKRYPGTLLHEPEAVATGAGTPFKVFTPFWRACLRRPDPQMPLGTPYTHPLPDTRAVRDALLVESTPHTAKLGQRVGGSMVTRRGRRARRLGSVLG